MDFAQQKNKKDNTDTLICSKRNLQNLKIRNAIPRVIPRTIKTEFESDPPIQCCGAQPRLLKLSQPPYTTGFSVTALNSSPEERIKRTPKGSNGSWTGSRGNSTYISTDSRVADFFPAEGNIQGITYQEGMPDFSEFAVAEVQIENMTSNRNSNFKSADQKLAEQRANAAEPPRTEKEIALWRRENKYTWHELNDGRIMQLIPTRLNAPIFTHFGGVAEHKKG